MLFSDCSATIALELVRIEDMVCSFGLSVLLRRVWSGRGRGGIGILTVAVGVTPAAPSGIGCEASDAAELLRLP